MGSFVQDVRLALRRLRRSPVFTLFAIASLASGIGAAARVDPNVAPRDL